MSAASRALRAALYQFAELRQELVYRLYGLPDEVWERTAEHVYRGPVALIDLLREEHLHDLEHMWQVRRHRELLAL
ncbi:MAG TPA: hypothetical protein VFA70_13710 [Dehalococcoidia bacterium]|jgi:hypothetical protein|nr:hypothetical protein [Dehalococcoidia bacterium]